ncbi:hypothetical protein PALB_7590 [Pseudoalteromonas luteoviolacea B = ATCC 29581]|nr:hypothetical protein PALB_7590 [Pseudoalteromonas luteoviolacea B = ATCC 29581]
MWFEFFYGLRQSKRNSKQLLLIGGSLSLVIVCLVVVLGIGERILSDRPEWFTTESDFITLGKANESGLLMPVSKAEQEILTSHSAVKTVASVTLYEQTLSLALRNQTQPITLALFDDALMSLLSGQLQSLLINSTDQPTVWVSHAFWQSQRDNLGKIGDTIYIGEAGKAFVLAGVLPSSASEIGGRSVQFWLHENWLPSIFKLQLRYPDSLDEVQLAQLEQHAKKIAINRIENRYLIIEPKHLFNSTSVATELEEKIANIHSGAQFIMQGGGGRYQFEPGVEFSPQVTEKLIEQWWLLLFFILGLAFVTTFNVVTYVCAQMVSREQEFTVRIIYGSSLAHFIRLFILEAIPFFGFCLSLCALSLFYIYDVIASHEAIVAVLGVALPQPSLFALLAAFSMLLLFSFAIFLAPSLVMFQSKLFSRQQGLGESRKQSYLQFTIIAIQMSVAGFCILLTVTYFHQQWQQREIKGFDADIREYEIKTIDTPLMTKSSVSQWLQTNPLSAFATTSFLDPKSVFEKVELHGLEKVQTRRLQVQLVSHNYFSTLRANFVAYGRLDEQSLVINEAALALFSLDSIHELDSYRIRIKDDNFRIAGVVEDLPHFGQHNRQVPMIYSLFSGKLPTISGFLLSSSPLNKSSLTERGSLYSQIIAYDQKRVWFLIGALSLLIFLFVVTLVTLFLHVSARMNKLTTLFGTYLALGMSDEQLKLACFRLLVKPLIIATSVLFIFAVFSMETNLQSLLYFLTSMVCLLSVCVALTIRSFLSLTNSSINTLLRG